MGKLVVVEFGAKRSGEVGVSDADRCAFDDEHDIDVAEYYTDDRLSEDALYLSENSDTLERLNQVVDLIESRLATALSDSKMRKLRSLNRVLMRGASLQSLCETLCASGESHWMAQPARHAALAREYYERIRYINRFTMNGGSMC